MLDKYEINAKRFIGAQFSVQYEDYARAIAEAHGTHPKAGAEYDYYSKVFMRLTDLKSDYFNIYDYKILLMQLMLGIRFGEMSNVSYRVNKKMLVVNIHSLKGTQDREIIFPSLSPLVSALTQFLAMPMPSISYKSYYRTLKKANPNFYSRFKTGHLQATHIARHFFVHMLFFVMRLKKKELRSAMGWCRDDTIDAYIDKDLFKCLNIGERNGKYNNRVNKKGKSAGFDNSRRSSNSTSSNKVNKKEKIKKK